MSVFSFLWSWVLYKTFKNVLFFSYFIFFYFILFYWMKNQTVNRLLLRAKHLKTKRKTCCKMPNKTKWNWMKNTKSKRVCFILPYNVLQYIVTTVKCRFLMYLYDNMYIHLYILYSIYAAFCLSFFYFVVIILRRSSLISYAMNFIDYLKSICVQLILNRCWKIKD